MQSGRNTKRIGRLVQVALIGAALGGCCDFVSVRGVITPSSADAIERQLDDGESDTILLDLDSDGGDVAAGQRVIAAIERAKLRAHVVTRVRRNCQSMCVAVFLAGTERLADTNARFMLHGVSAGGVYQSEMSFALLGYYAARGVDPQWMMRQVARGYLLSLQELVVSGGKFIDIIDSRT